MPCAISDSGVPGANAPPWKSGSDDGSVVFGNADNSVTRALGDAGMFIGIVPSSCGSLRPAPRGSVQAPARPVILQRLDPCLLPSCPGTPVDRCHPARHLPARPVSEPPERARDLSPPLRA
ncbi:hypothetical protein G6F65_021096 [Rhizopus arrhizus]|nr:hypothetical protein G6F65_021096 [Rhizopus arrhizus]